MSIDALPTPPYFTALHGEVLSVEPAEGRVAMRFPVRPEQCGVFGTAQGGFLTAMADCAVGACVYLVCEGRRGATLELSARFLRPVVEGWVTARGVVLHRGRNTVVVEVEIVDEKGRLCTKTTATNVLLGPAPGG